MAAVGSPPAGHPHRPAPTPAQKPLYEAPANGVEQGHAQSLQTSYRFLPAYFVGSELFPGVAFVSACPRQRKTLPKS